VGKVVQTWSACVEKVVRTLTGTYVGTCEETWIEIFGSAWREGCSVHCVETGPWQGKVDQKYAEGFDLHLDYQCFDFEETSF
jgi:hypothetical protein